VSALLFRIAKDLIDRMLTFDPAKRITASEALKHQWITNEQNAVARDEPNLIVNVRKGFNSKHSFQTIVTAVSVLNHWKHLEDDSDSDEKEVTSKRNSHLHVANPDASE
jgi:calcium/calmodulin-dependent protein kinase I